MLEELITNEVQNFISIHERSDVHELLFRYKAICNLPASIVIDQISGKRKAKEKFPTFYATKGIIYPPSTNVEQSSSEVTAGYKVEILKSLNIKSYKTLVDLTGGFGIDTFQFSKLFEKIIYVEPNTSLLEIARHNHKTLGQVNIQYINISGEEFLEKDNHADIVYIDPSRRNLKSGKIFRFADCEPNVIELQHIIFSRSALIFIKASPLLDIQRGIKELRFVKKVIVVSVNNECKELLFLCEKNYAGEVSIDAINLREEFVESFSFLFSKEKSLVISFSDPLDYLYEPNTSILKGGAFKNIAHKYGLLKIHPSTHLYTSGQIIPHFPGRIFKIESMAKSDKKSLKTHFPEMKANIILRNYPLSVDELKKKTKLIEGGKKYLIGFSGVKNKYLAVCDRIT